MTDKGKLPKRKPRTYENQRKYMLKHRYGISISEYNSLLVDQQYRCAICEREASELTYPLFVDHCHKTGDVRGLLCANCNRFLGHLKDDARLIANAITYLNKRTLRSVQP